MFLKRKSSWELIKSILVDPFNKDTEHDPELFVLKTNERRNSYRVQPAEDEPVFFRLDDNTMKVNNISAHGLSFNNENYEVGKLFIADINLPGFGPQVSATIQIINIDPSNRCHCKFIEIEDAARERIHHYVLNRQKEHAREIKEAEKKNKSTKIQITSETN